MPRLDGRQNNELRPLAFVPDYQLHPLGSVLAVCGRTRVVCAVSVEDAVPSWMKAQNVSGGWITAEYQMLPSATNTRSTREVTKGKLSGRSAEIQRLIGRSLRAVVDLEKLPGITLHVDCDVIDADGGTMPVTKSRHNTFLNAKMKKWPKGRWTGRKKKNCSGKR